MEGRTATKLKLVAGAAAIFKDLEATGAPIVLAVISTVLPLHPKELDAAPEASVAV